MFRRFCTKVGSNFRGGFVSKERSVLLYCALVSSVASILSSRREEVAAENGVSTKDLNSKESEEVHKLLSRLQTHFLFSLDELVAPGSTESRWKLLRWDRDGGQHGGGIRFEKSGTELFSRATVNVSNVHFEDVEKYPIDSATALSVILHPKNPYVPSLHFHISFVETRSKKSTPYWRMIADLNPAIESRQTDNAERFKRAVGSAIMDSVPKGEKTIDGEYLFRCATEFGNKYFYVPVLNRFRGVFHFFAPYVSPSIGVSSATSKEMAERFSLHVISTYVEIARHEISLHRDGSLTAEDYGRQLFYHTLYFFQVITLDRGTTHGLLAHDQNDIGTLASLPNRVDCSVLRSWQGALKYPQSELLGKVVELLEKSEGDITDKTRGSLANIIRHHYRTHGIAATKEQAAFNVQAWKDQFELQSTAE